MQTGYILAEVAATMIESTVALAAVTAVCRPRYQGWKHIWLVLLFSCCLTAIVSVLNTQSLFSYVTPIVAMAFIILVSSKVTSLGSLLTRSSFCLFSYIVIQVLDYVILVIYGLVLQIPESVFSLLMEPSRLRTAYILTAKLCDVIVYFAFRASLQKIEKLPRKLQIGFFSLGIVSYASMQFLFSTIVSTDLAVMQTVVIFSWIFLIGFVIAALALASSRAQSEKEKQTQLLLESENAMMAENYRQLHSIQQENAKNLHDFKHHIQAIKGLAETRKEGEIISYANTLLETSYRQAAACHSGSDIIDAILNSKAAEAEQDGISLRFSANFQIPTNLDPVDVCGILANQIDNAFDACKKIPTPADRKVKVEIKQVHNFAFFKVENTVAADPFEGNPELKSTKEDDGLHGLGLKSIRSIAEKYEGSLRNEYKDGWFVSVVSLSFQPGGVGITIL